MIRLAEKKDIVSINDIYNQAVAARFETADIDPISYADRLKWYDLHNKTRYPVFVYEIDEKVVAWLSISPYRQGRMALRNTAEISYYVDKKKVRQGIGSQLISHGLSESKKLNYSVLIAIVLDRNNASMNILEKHGFTAWGRLPGVADFKGEICGHVYYGINLSEKPCKNSYLHFITE